jgi:hypothetical protein
MSCPLQKIGDIQETHISSLITKVSDASAFDPSQPANDGFRGESGFSSVLARYESTG